MNFPQLPEILNIHNAENIYNLSNLSLERINNAIHTYNTFISRLEQFEETQTPILMSLKRALPNSPKSIASYPQSKEDSLKELKYIISSNIQVHFKMKALDLNFLYLVNTFIDNAEEQIIDAIFMPPVNDIEQTYIDLAMQAPESPLRNRIAGGDLNFLFDLQNILQTKTQIEIFGIDWQRMNGVIVDGARHKLEERLVAINDYLLQTVLQNTNLQTLVIREDFIVVRRLKSIFVDSRLYEGTYENLEILKQKESYEYRKNVKQFRTSLLENIIAFYPASQRAPITMIINDETIAQRIQQPDIKFIKELLEFFPDSQDLLQKIFLQSQYNKDAVFDGRIDYIKDLLQLFPASRDQIQEIVFQNQKNIKKIFDGEIDFIRDLVEILPTSKVQIQEIVFQNQANTKRMFDVEERFIKEIVKILPTSQDQIQEIVFNNESTVLRIANPDLAFASNLLYVLPASEDKIQEIVFQNKDTIKKMYDADLIFLSDLADYLPFSRNKIQEIVFQNQATIRRIADLDIDLIKEIVKSLPDSKIQVEEIIFGNPNIENKFLPENFKVIKEMIELFPTLKQNIMNIIVQNPNNKIKMLELDLNFKNQLLNIDITSEEISLTFLNNQEIVDRMSKLDYDFIERFVNFFPNTKYQILYNILKNPEIRNTVEQLDFYSLHQFPEIFLNSFKNPLLDRLFDSQIIKFNLANLNERNIDILINFKDGIYELFNLTDKDKESMPERFLEEIINSDNNFHEQLLQLNINSINKLRSLIYLNNTDLLLEYLNIMFFENEDFYQQINEPYLNIVQRLFVDSLNPSGNNRKSYLGLNMANALTDSIFNTKEGWSNLTLRQISEGNVGLIYSLHHFFESMFDYGAIKSRSQEYYNFQHQCIRQFCESEVFITRMSKESDFILQLNFILNRDNGHFGSVNTFFNYKCYMQNTIEHKINYNNEKIQNILNKTFLDNLEMFIIMITRNNKYSINNFKSSFLGATSNIILKNIQGSPLTEENIEFVNNLKNFYIEVEDKGNTNLSEFFNEQIFLQLSKENQQRIKDNLIQEQQYNVSRAKKNFTVLHAEQLFNIGKVEQQILFSQKLIESYSGVEMTEASQKCLEEEQALLKRNESTLLSMRIVPADKQVKATNNIEEHGILKVQAIFKAYQVIQDEELILQNWKNKTPEEVEVIAQQKRQEEVFQQQQKALIEQQQKALIEQQQQKALIEQQQQKALIDQQAKQKAIDQQAKQKALIEQQTLAQKTSVKRVIVQDARVLDVLLANQQVQQKLTQQKRDLETAIQQRRQEFMDQQKQKEQILAQKTGQEKIQYIITQSKSPKFFIEAQNSLLSTKNKLDQFKKALESRQMKMPGKK